MKLKAKILTIVLVLATLISIIGVFAIPASAATITGGTTLYLKPNSNWKKDSARFAAAFMNSNKSTTSWASMTDNDADGIYEVVAPSGSWSYVIFCRMNPSASANNWNNKWNQTADLSITSLGTNNCYTVKDGTWDSGGGTWSKFTAPVYRVAGAIGLVGVDWDVTNNNAIMTDADGDGTYTLVLKNVTAGTYGFKIAVNGTWDVAYGKDGGSDNASVTVAAGNCNVTISFTPATKSVSAKATSTHTPNADDNNCTTAVTCKDCGATTTPAKSHVAGADDGDCTTAIKCSNVGCTQDAVAGNAIHTAGNDDGDCTTAIKCSNAGCTQDAVAGNASHTAGADDGDCTTPIKCEDCDQNAVAAKSHTYDNIFDLSCNNTGCTHEREACQHPNTTFVKGTDATCTTAGVTDGYQCNDCKEWASGHETISSTGHSYGAASYKWNDAHTTCTATRVCGNDANHTETANATVTSEITDAKCTVDGKTIYTATFTEDWTATQTFTLILTASGHSFGATTEYKAATCLAAGNDAYKYCSQCELYYAGAAADNESTDNGKDDTTSFVIAKKAHTLNSRYECSECENRIVYVKNTGWANVNCYTWPEGGNGIVGWPGEAMTDEGDGLWSYLIPISKNCTNVIFNNGSVQTGDLDLPTNCKVVYNKSAGDWETAGHIFDLEVMTQDTLKDEATCNSYAIYYKSCSCGAVSNSDEYTFEDIEGGYSTNHVAPIGTACGSDFVCTICLNPIKGNHANVVTDAAVDPTCTETGLTEGSHCAACDTVIVAQEVVDALGHTKGADATCTTNQICTVCEVELKAALGHNFVNGNCDRCDCIKVFFKPGSDWAADNAWFAVYHFSVGNAWEKMTLENGVYTAIVPEGDTIIFCRMNPAFDVLGWDDGDDRVWNQTVDIAPGNNCFIIDNPWDSNKEDKATVKADAHEVTSWSPINETTHSGICTVCGETVVADHTYEGDWQIGADNHWKKCVCEATTEAAHNYENYTSNNNAGCTTNATETGACVCGKTHTREIADTAAGHDFNDVIPQQNSTCLATGRVAYKTCKNCDKYFFADATKFAGGAAESSFNALTTAGGFVIAQLDHDYSGDIKADANGTTHSFKCKNGCDEYGNATAHDYDQTVANDTYKVSDATCTAQAVYNKSCACGAEGNETFSAGEKDPTNHSGEQVNGGTADVHTKWNCCGVTVSSNHEFGNWAPVVDTNTHKRTCSCGYSETAEHSFANYVYNDDAKCTVDGTETGTCVCGETHTRTKTGSQTGHTAGAEATCTTAQKCTVCEEVLVDALGHTEEIIPAVAPTCKPGLTEGKKCSVCGEILVQQNDIPANGVHVFENGVCTKCDIPAKASIEGNYYLTLADAVAAAQANDVINLLANDTITKTLDISKSLTINTGAFDITSKADVAFNITASNVTFELIGKVIVSDPDAVANARSGGVAVAQTVLTMDDVADVTAILDAEFELGAGDVIYSGPVDNISLSVRAAYEAALNKKGYVTNDSTTPGMVDVTAKSLYYIGDDGYWYFDDVKTGVLAKGENGQSITITSYDKQPVKDGEFVVSHNYVITFSDGTEITINVPVARSIVSVEYDRTEDNKDIYVITYSDGSTSEFTVTNGTDGHSPVITIENGEWCIDGTPTGIKALGKDGKGIKSINKTTDGLVDTYTIIYTDDTEFEFTVTNGRGIVSISLTSTSADGLVDTYTITYNDGTTSTFTVTNGANGINGIQGEKGDDGHTPVITIQNGKWHIDGVDTGMQAQGVKGETGNGISDISKTGIDRLVDTYTITYTDGTTTTFTVTNGAQGAQGIQGIQGVPGKDGHTPVITIGENGNWFIDGADTGVKAEAIKGETGAPGADGEDGDTPYIGENGNWWIDGVDTGVKAEGKDGNDNNKIIIICIGIAALCIITTIVAVATKKFRRPWWILC